MNNNELDVLLKALGNVDFDNLLLAADKLARIVELIGLMKEYKGIDDEIILEAIEENFGSGFSTIEKDELDQFVEAINTVVKFIVLLELIQDYKKENNDNNESSDDDERIQKAFAALLHLGTIDKDKDKQEKLKEAFKNMPYNEWF